MNYNEFIESKLYKIDSVGIDIDENNIHPKLFDFQHDIVYIPFHAPLAYLINI